MVNEIKKQFPNMKFTTTSDVIEVLKYLGKPGENQELKKSVISELFITRSPQGFTTADSLDGYKEY